ncbi:MAG: dihydroorotase [Euryarchaeota archaeon]|nr:dihydroorotase [Euryarchaeota archaeon]
MLVLEGRAFFRGGLESLAVGIEDGRIVRVAKTLRGDENRDYGERLLLPGAIDLHVHFRDPGHPEAEDFASGTAAAAIGGVTTVFDMPNTDPPVTNRASYEAKLAAVRRKANVDFGLYGALRAATDVRTFVSLGAPGKMYMAHSAGRVEVTEERTWREIVAALSDTGAFAVAHAEDPRKIAAETGKSLADHDRVRPPEAEASAIRALVAVAQSAKSPPRVHIAHVTSRAALDALKGSGFSTEVTPHHLFLDRTMPLNAYGKVNPPLRTADDRFALWTALVERRIDIVASDHAPRTREDKDVAFAEALPGAPGVETMIPLLLEKVKRGELRLERFVEIAARRPAQLLGLDTGILDIGRPANLIAVDPRALTTIKAADLHSTCGWTPYEGYEAVFPEATFLRGELVAERRELVAERLGRPVAIPAAKPS